MKTILILVVLFSLFDEVVPQKWRRLTSEENQELQGFCGSQPMIRSMKRKLTNSKIISRTEAPWAVMIHTPGWVCSGTLISQRHILTSRVCILTNLAQTKDHEDDVFMGECIDDDFVVYFSGHSLQITLTKPIVIKDSKIILFDKCKENDDRQFDMALIELEDDLQFTNEIHPACSVSRQVSPVVIGDLLEINSYGSTDYESKIRKNIGKLQKGRVVGDNGGSVMSTTLKLHTLIGVLKSNRRDYNSGVQVSSVAYASKKICQYSGIC
ncbi:hypothetical protein CRE_31293 [Caenorhabditis remanei]|uniref:Uncharacterized protein n=1 Tax=Caenorhabditis remanei TaxID=31234 RepID=E3MLP4_CAERE|nr:hypothetical protein CRE_31293 [Caenorhabditis remanei]